MASPQLYGAPIGRDRNLADVMAAQETLRGTCLTITNALSALTMPLIKRGPQTKDAMLGWLARAFDANKARGRLRVDRRHVASDGFMFNCLKLLLLWVQPMTDFGLTKLHLIDPAYLFTASTRLEAWSDETAMAVDRATWLSMRDRWQQRHTAHHQAAPKFVTEVFYLTLAGLHYGFLATIKFYTQFQKDIDHTASEIKRLRATWRAQTAAAATPPAGSTAAATLSPQHQATLTAFMLRKAIANHDHMVALQLAMQAALFDRATWDQIIAFYRLLAGWMLRILATEPSQVIQGQLEAVPRLNVEGRRHPLPADTLFATLPEWVVEDYVDFYVFVCRHHPVLFQEVVPDDFLTFAMVILDQPHVIKNPYLKSKLVEVLFYFTLPIYRDRDGQPISRVRDSLAIHPLCQQRLVRVLLRFYVDVEQTGMASQFYDKFNIRYNISQIIRAIWDQPLHRHEIIKQARALTSFVRFVNLLMNDTTYLLDEALTKLGDIHSLQKEMDSAEWATQPQAYQEEKRQALSQAERQATSCMSLGNETVHMLQLFTQESEIVEPFMEAYIVERLAAMMNYNLAALAGPKCTELKVRHPERYHFNPKRLLSELILIYLHLADQPAFVAAMAKDGRSYARQHFERAGTILIKHHLLDPGPKGLGALTQLVSAIEAAIAADVQEEDDLGDVPDHFMDPLMFTIMNEPVILPTSNMTLDLSTIKSHLLSDTHDPFNRQPLVIEDVVPNTALKAEIAAWRAARREAKQAANAAP
ncbi:hypothetical protein CXG81DRAFT_10500 [Caulochytrium protostelioides]|uniref:RING-type E3 ubiquitin transferase n=1 Tax=Caulochytrium protostelioides TaxID=1555241 RepID=A0A4P9XBC4_9FUNG|nr:hypothetical protein CXG81DRAFT_10500 [Caulochytrium protostelioides]|eukprot:RKP02703.1 hypothetical protein CXG81DRAFT_10500 [Caulochytrium protostelioides]